MEKFFTKIKRRESPLYAFLYNTAFRFKRLNMPRFVLPVYRGIWPLRQGLINFLRRMATFFYYEPMFRSRCKRVGKSLNYIKLRQGLPYVSGNIHLFLGERVTIHSRSSFAAASLFETPSFHVGDKTYLGPGLSIGVAKSISIGSYCHIASNVTILDNDGHPLDPLSRARGDPVNKKDVSPVQVGNNVWIGEGSIILKGVFIGEGSVVAARSVVVRDVKPYSVVAGNPATTIKRLENRGKPVRIIESGHTEKSTGATSSSLRG